LKAKSYLPKPDVHGPKRIRIDSHNAPPKDDSKSAMFATHMTAHLQDIMLLTLRLISIEGAMNESGDSQSVATDSNQTSWVTSGSRNREIDLPGRLWQADTELLDEAADPEYTTQAPETVPDCDYMDWDHVPRNHEETSKGNPGTASITGIVPIDGHKKPSDTE
jgi:hypothetical protein